MVYRKLKRTWSHNDMNYIPNLMKVFPELSKLSSEELCNRFSELNIDFYCEKRTPVSLWLRLSLPFAIATIIIMFISLPFLFMATGKWGFSLGEKNKILNWLRALGLQ